MTFFQCVQKRSFDVCASALGLLVLWPVIMISWFIARGDTGASGFFVQERIGRNAKPFSVVKLRTMWAGHSGGTVTVSNDARITPWGAFFRKWKLDELPQLLNVLKGDMSFVGPRPDVKGYMDELTGESRVLWSLRPGITGPATLKYKDEEEILAAQKNPIEYNDTVIWPDKVQINIQYLKNWSLLKDFHYIVRTIL